MDATPCSTSPSTSSPTHALPGQDADYRTLLTDHYGMVERLVRSVARRHRLDAQEGDDLLSLVHVKLVEHDYAILRKFRGRSHLSTYLTTVIVRIAHDARIARWGKWRPSMQARRLGATGIRLERLVVRDGMPIDDACAVMRANFRVPESEALLREMAALFPRRTRARLVPTDALEDFPSHDLTPDDAGDGERDRRVHRSVAQAFRALAPEDRHLIRLRFTHGWTVARIARTMQIDQKATYRTFERLCRTLRRAAEAAASDVAHAHVVTHRQR